MGILDFFKNKKTEIEKEKTEISIDNNLNNIDKLENWLYKKEQEIEKKEKKLSALIFERQLQLISELEENLRKLEKLDINKRREEEKIKLIVTRNQELFIGHVKQLIDEMKNIEKQEKIKEYIKKINSTITLFEKASFSSFQKATILIGKEIANIKESISNFFNYSNRLLRENKELFDRFDSIKILKENLNELNKNNKTKEELMENLVNKNKNIKKLKLSLRENEKLLTETRESDEYRKKIEFERQTSEKEWELKRKIQDLREELNIKLLLKHFHKDKKKKEFVERYNETFLLALLEDKDIKILELAREIGKSLDTRNFSEIKNLQSEINSRKKKLPIDEKIDEIANLIKSTQYELESIQRQIEKEKNKLEKIREKDDGVLNNIKLNINSLGIKISP